MKSERNETIKMDNAVIPISLNDINCNIHFFGSISSGSNVPLFIMPIAGEVSDLIEGQHMRLDPIIESDEVSSHILVTFEVKNWNDDLSPWPAPAIGRNQNDFGGFSAKTLYWIQDGLIPKVTSYVPNVQNGHKGLLGYSMAGMFALWTMSQTDIFTVYASCSGSLWYDGFCEYIERTTPLSICSIYISLGEREEFSRNPWFAKVGDATRKTASLLKTLPICQEIQLVWNPGGHLGRVGERLAAAQLWMKKSVNNKSNNITKD